MKCWYLSKKLHCRIIIDFKSNVILREFETRNMVKIKTLDLLLICEPFESRN
jgi:hypothetical protein